MEVAISRLTDITYMRELILDNFQLQKAKKLSRINSQTLIGK